MKEAEIDWREFIVSSAKVTGGRHISEDISTSLPHSPHLVFTQLEEQWQLESEEIRICTLKYMYPGSVGLPDM